MASWVVKTLTASPITCHCQGNVVHKFPSVRVVGGNIIKHNLECNRAQLGALRYITGHRGATQTWCH